MGHRTSYKRHFLPIHTNEILLMWWSMGEKFWSPSKNDVKTNDNIQRISTGYGDDYTTGCLRD